MRLKRIAYCVGIIIIIIIFLQISHYLSNYRLYDPMVIVLRFWLLNFLFGLILSIDNIIAIVKTRKFIINHKYTFITAFLLSVNAIFLLSQVVQVPQFVGQLSTFLHFREYFNYLIILAGFYLPKLLAGHK